MAWSVLTWNILQIFQSQFLSGEVGAKTRHSSYTSTLYVNAPQIKTQAERTKLGGLLKSS